jgi:ferredoxin--NADP+ reductase
MHSAGCRVLGILGARTSDLVILEEELRSCCAKLLVATDDGTRGRRGVVTDCLGELLAAGEPIMHVLAIGPIRMMQAVAELTRERKIKTLASLNALMVDGTGMCGGCRVLVGGQTRFACVEGPEFDAHQVDFEVLARRSAAYRSAERQSWDNFRANPSPDLAEVAEQCRLVQQHPELAS